MSKLELVDLAGSERAGVLNEDEKIARESVLINKSLFTLRKVITTLTESQGNGKAAYIPYRDSKLTSILRQSIGGSSYCLMISCLAPSDKFIEENLSTLGYSVKTAYIANQPVKNKDPNAKLVRKLKVGFVLPVVANCRTHQRTSTHQ